ncbi:MAG: toll/interleukin-1 receptor domain-containing protein [Deltaproteobacteria bacterium]|nr:toll/interleukin-1 receptor domain-containing protein [Deltaproteobacteria bacterium]
MIHFLARLFRPKVFCSYARADAATVASAVKVVRAVSVSVFMDVDTIPPGAKWRKEITAGIWEAKRVLVFWSRSAADSEWVRQEWELAHRWNKIIVPVLLDDTPLPEILSEYNAIDGRALAPSRERLGMAIVAWEATDRELLRLGRRAQLLTLSSVAASVLVLTVATYSVQECIASPESLRTQVSRVDEHSVALHPRIPRNEPHHAVQHNSSATAPANSVRQAPADTSKAVSRDPSEAGDSQTPSVPTRISNPESAGSKPEIDLSSGALCSNLGIVVSSIANNFDGVKGITLTTADALYPTWTSTVSLEGFECLIERNQSGHGLMWHCWAVLLDLQSAMALFDDAMSGILGCSELEQEGYRMSREPLLATRDSSGLYVAPTREHEPQMRLYLDSTWAEVVLHVGRPHTPTDWEISIVVGQMPHPGPH